MEDLGLKRQQLIEVLLADKPWGPGDVCGHHVSIEDPVAELFWERFLEDLACSCVDRLMDPNRISDRLVPRETAINLLVHHAHQLGVHGSTVAVTPDHPVARESAQMWLALSPVDLDETCAVRLERLRAIVEVARMCAISDVVDVVRSPVTRDQVLLISTTASAFRDDQRARIDAKRPEIIDVHVDRLCRSIGELLRIAPQQVKISVSNFPSSEHYWQVRAWWMQHVEIQIDRVWPGCALGSQHVPMTEA